jgi:hypothetical protein
VYLDPMEKPSAIVPIVTAGAAVLLLELLGVFLIRRGRARAAA